MMSAAISPLFCTDTGVQLLPGSGIYGKINKKAKGIEKIRLPTGIGVIKYRRLRKRSFYPIQRCLILTIPCLLSQEGKMYVSL
jgi:hypothetical protein